MDTDLLPNHEECELEEIVPIAASLISPPIPAVPLRIVAESGVLQVTPTRFLILNGCTR